MVLLTSGYMLTTENGLNSICRRNANQSRFQREWTGKKKDSELLHQAQKIVSNLLNKRDPFTRITNHRVCNLTGESYKVLRNLEKKLPNTKKYLDSVTETSLQFQYRKIAQVVQGCSATQVSEDFIYRKAAIVKYRHKELMIT